MQLISVRLAELEKIGGEVGDEAAATLSEVESGAQDIFILYVQLRYVGLEIVFSI